jgi:hypothetical protein
MTPYSRFLCRIYQSHRDAEPLLERNPLTNSEERKVALKQPYYYERMSQLNADLKNRTST